MHTQVWVRELAAALMDMGNKPNAPAQASVEELVLAGVSHACLILAKPIAVQPNTVLLLDTRMRGALQSVKWSHLTVECVCRGRSARSCT